MVEVMPNTTLGFAPINESFSIRFIFEDVKTIQGKNGYARVVWKQGREVGD